MSVHAKMCGILENKEVDTRYGKKTVQTVVLADATGIIRLTLWEQKQNKVQENICYQISNLISNNFKNYLQLNTTQDTTFTETDPLENVMEDFSSLHNTKSLTGKIEFCSLSSTLKCMQCLKTINLEENQSFVKCGTCGAKQKLSQEQMSDMLKFQLKTMDNKRIKLVMFDVTIKNMKKENKLMGKTNDEIEDFLLDHETWKITTEEGSDLAESISLVN